MQYFARLDEGKVAEVIEIPDGENLSDYFHPDIVANCVPAYEGLAQGWMPTGEEGVFEPPAEVVPQPAYRTFKADVWRRCTEAEAEALDTALAAQPARLRRLWEDSTILEHDAPEWPILAAGVAAVVGEDRAAEILAPST